MAVTAAGSSGRGKLFKVGIRKWRAGSKSRYCRGTDALRTQTPRPIAIAAPYMLTTLDHVALVVRDLNAATTQYSALLGCTPTLHGADSGVENTWFQLGNIGLNIIAPGKGDRAQAQLDQYGEGLWAMAFATPDIAKTRHILERRGIPSTEPHTQRTRATSVLAPEDTHGTAIFLVEQQTDAIPPVSPATCDASAAVVGLDHIVITTPQPDRAAALYGARLGLEMKLDRTNPDWGSRLMFFKCGDLVIEIAHDLKKGVSDGPDHVWGLSWHVPNIAATRARLAAADFNVSEVRAGRKPGTQVFTVRDKTASVPTIVLGRV
jgi:catechol 2,3-dioxygenase-like lactoylglutathione lyase family enzyme